MNVAHLINGPELSSIKISIPVKIRDKCKRDPFMFGLVRMFNQVIHNAIIIIVIKKENRKDKKIIDQANIIRDLLLVQITNKFSRK